MSDALYIVRAILIAVVGLTAVVFVMMIPFIAVGSLLLWILGIPQECLAVVCIQSAPGEITVVNK